MKIVLRHLEMEETLQGFFIPFLLHKAQPCFLQYAHVIRMPLFQFHQALQAFLLAAFSGCNIFEISQQKAEHLFYTKGSRGCDAKGFYNSNGFTVLRGSVIASGVVPSFKWKEKRDILIKEYLSLENGKFIMNSDMTFPSPSTAAVFVLGRPSNGWTDWTDKDGNTLDSVYRRQLE